MADWSFILACFLGMAVFVAEGELASSGRMVPNEQSSTVNLAQRLVEDLLRFAETPKFHYAVEGNADEYIDRLVVQLKNYFKDNGYDPLHVRDLAELHWLNLWGLSSVKRTGPATLKHDNSDLVIEANLGFGGLKGEAYFEYQLWWIFWITGTARFDIQNIRFYGRVRLAINQVGVKPSLEALDITDWGNMDVKLEDGNWIGTMASWFPSLVTNFIKDNVPPMIVNAVRNILASVNINWPIGRSTN